MQGAVVQSHERNGMTLSSFGIKGKVGKKVCYLIKTALFDMPAFC